MLKTCTILKHSDSLMIYIPLKTDDYENDKNHTGYFCHIILIK